MSSQFYTLRHNFAGCLLESILECYKQNSLIALKRYEQMSKMTLAQNLSPPDIWGRFLSYLILISKKYLQINPIFANLRKNY